MLHHTNTKRETHLYWGGRNENAFELYKDSTHEHLKNNTLKKLNLAYSRANKSKVYVQELLQRDAEFIAKTLNNKGVIMICGSLAMQNNVLNTLENICMRINNTPLQHYKEKNQLKMDCY